MGGPVPLLEVRARSLPTLGFRRLSAGWLKLSGQGFVSSAAEIRLVSVLSRQNALGSTLLVLTRSWPCFWGGNGFTWSHQHVCLLEYRGFTLLLVFSY